MLKLSFLKRTSLLLAFSLIFSTFATSQISLGGNNKDEVDPVTWTEEYKQINDNEFELIFKGTPNGKWVFYSQYTEGTMPLTFGFDKTKGFETIGDLKESPKPKEKYDELLGGNTKYWDKTATFTQKIKLTTLDKVNVKGYIDYQACIDGACTMLTYEFSFDLKADKIPEAVQTQNQESNKNDKEKIEENVATDSDKQETNNINVDDKEKETHTKSVDVSEIDIEKYKEKWWSSVKEQVKEFEDEKESKSFIWLLIIGFLGGLVALITPCVWPMIPMTVSFFLKKSNKSGGKRDAIIYGLSIVIIFVSLGLGVTAIFGPDAMNKLATSAGFNVAFFLLLVIFAAAFFGAFELTLPSSWTNKIDAKADKTTGIISIFLMAFTLVLVSFSCTGPIVGTLLVESVTIGKMGPFWGMLGFSLGLALPFSLFAIFPSMMNKMPKSGGWLNSVKVVLGFIELALAFKFLSVADMAYHWNILDRDVFIAIWVVIFSMLGFYLLGKIRFAHDSPVEKVNVFRTFMAIVVFSFTIYMIPGMWGAPVKAISAFAPPTSTLDFNLNKDMVHPDFTNYEEGMAYAKKEGKPVLLDFTGWACVNCRKMENDVWPELGVKELIEEEFVLISLYVDDKEKLPEDERYVSERGVTIRTVGNKWSDLQITKFGKSSQPYYVILDNEGNLLNKPRAFNTNVNAYKRFLEEGLEIYRNKK